MLSFTKRLFEGLRGRFAAASLLFLVLALVYVASIDIRASRGAGITGDEPFYLLTTQSLIADLDLDLTNQYEQRSYESFFDHPDGLWRQSVPNEDGVLLSPHNPGLSVYLVPGFALAGLAGVQVQLLLTAAMAFALTFVLVARLAGSDLAAWLATAAVGVSATPFIYATEVYPEVPAAALLVGALLLLTIRERPALAHVAAAAVLLNVMVWFGVKYAPLAVLVAALGLYRADTGGRAAILALGGVGAAFFASFHLHTFDALTPYSVNIVYAGNDTTQLIDHHVSFGDRVYRLWGLYIDRRFGLLHWAPVLALAFPGALLALRAGLHSRALLTLIGVQMLIATFVAITMMGWWFPGRTMMTVLPLFALPLALFLKDASTAGRTVFGSLAAYSAATTAALVYAGHNGEIVIAVDPFDLSSPVFAWLNPLFPQYTSWSAETWWLTAGWLAIGAAGLAVYAFRWPGLPARLVAAPARLRSLL